MHRASPCWRKRSASVQARRPKKTTPAASGVRLQTGKRERDATSDCVGMERRGDRRRMTFFVFCVGIVPEALPSSRKRSNFREAVEGDQGLASIEVRTTALAPAAVRCSMPRSTWLRPSAVAKRWVWIPSASAARRFSSRSSINSVSCGDLPARDRAISKISAAGLANTCRYHRPVNSFDRAMNQTPGTNELHWWSAVAAANEAANARLNKLTRPGSCLVPFIGAATCRTNEAVHQQLAPYTIPLAVRICSIRR